jgi:NADPH2:quinone reductase
MKAIQVTEFGGPEVLVYSDLPDPTVTADQFLVKVSHVGVN